MRLNKNKDSAAMFLIMEGIIYTMVLNLYNPFTQMFAKRMGGGDLHTTLINSLPPLTAIFLLLPAGILIERLNRKKQTVMFLLSIISLFYATIAFVPMIPHEAKVMIFVILIGLMNGPGSLYLTTWQSFFADNFEGFYASRLYTMRSKYSALFGLVTVLVTGLLLTKIPKTDAERLILYQIFYGVCFLLTVLQILLFSRVKGQKTVTPGIAELQTKHDLKYENRKDNEPKKKMRLFNKEDFAGMLKNKKFLLFCLCGFVFHMAWQMAWPLFFIYFSDYAYLNELQISIVNLSSGVTQFLTFSLWNKLIEKKGGSMVIIVGAAGLAVSPFIYTFSVGFPVIIMQSIFAGAFQAAFNVTLFICLLETLPLEKKTVYIAVFNTLTSLTGFVAPLIGLWVLNMTGIYIAMAIDGIFRVAGTLLYLVRWLKGRDKGLSKTVNADKSLAS